MTPKDYFQSYRNTFWTWEEDGSVISIRNGSTIVYTEELIDILRAIATNGLAPLGTILLSIIAINNTESNDINHIEELFRNYVEKDIITDDDLTRCIQFMKLLQSLPVEYKIGKRKKILLSTIFEHCHNRSSRLTSEGIIKNATEKEKLIKFSSVVFDINEKKIKKEIQVLSQLTYLFKDIDSIIERIGNLPKLEEEYIPYLETVSVSDNNYSDFVEELTDNIHTFQIGALIKPIWAGLHIPIVNAHSSEQPIGGVSDISNKGTYDKLLISEFANEDIVFMSRIANNEALYIQREMPPVSDKLERIILIDITIKTWGIPKTLAHATSIAITKHPKSKISSQVYLVAEKYIPVNYSNLNGIIDSIQHVSIHLDAVKGLEQFLLDNKNKKLEIFYITTPALLKNNEVQKIIAEYNSSFKYIITTSDLGEIQFYKNKNKALKCLETIKLDIKKLWTTNKFNKPEKLAIISKKDNYPILFNVSNKKYTILPINNSLIFYIYKKSLFKYVINEQGYSYKGSELILNDITANGKFEIGKNENGEILFLSYHHNNKELKIINLNTLEEATCFYNKYNNSNFSGFFFIDNQFEYVNSYSIAEVLYPNFNTKTIEFKTKDINQTTYKNINQSKVELLNKHSKIGQNYNILKNINTICINKNQLLCFNQHALQLLIDSEAIGYDTAYPTERNRENFADFDNIKQAFVFKDGSEIEVNFYGMLTLRSSNKLIPPIYIPTSIGKYIGVATEAHFAGNDYFYKLPYYSFEISSFSKSEKLNAVKIIKAYTSLGLIEIKNITNRIPSKFSLHLENKKAHKMVEELIQLGCDISYSKNMNSDQEIISVKEFYMRYIQKFINEIIHATNT